MEDNLVRDLMTDGVFAVTPDDDLVKVCDLMAEHHLRHVPVVDVYGRLVGLVSHRDLLRNRLVEQDLPDYVTTDVRRQLKVGSLMTSPVQSVAQDTEIRVAAQIMYKHKYGCLPVVEDDRLIGILTEADFVRYAI